MSKDIGIAPGLDTTCPACSRAGRPLRLTKEGRYRLIRCGGCRTEYFRPDGSLREGGRANESVSEYWEDYKFQMYASPDVQQDYAARYDRALSLATGRLGEIGSVLDVGCGIGNFLAYAQDRQLQASGMDVDSNAVKHARERGLVAFTPQELDEQMPDSSIDAVTMWDVIEHLYEPRPVVQSLARKVRPGGAMLLETPDAAFPLRALLLALHATSGGRVDLTDPLYYWEHKIYFTLAGLKILLDGAGFDVVAVRRETSPRAKMHRIFTHAAQERGRLGDRFLAGAWPLMESAARRTRIANKLVVVARKR